jgi:hypothetical protein
MSRSHETSVDNDNVTAIKGQSSLELFISRIPLTLPVISLNQDICYPDRSAKVLGLAVPVKSASLRGRDSLKSYPHTMGISLRAVFHGSINDVVGQPT